jgi:site-specific recombinase XerD
MNNVEIPRPWHSALARLEGAYSPHTLRGYRADIEVFDAWCVKNKLQALPATPETVAAFIAAQAPKHSSATLKRRLAAIRKIHRLLRMENPVTDEEVVIAMRRALRSKCARPQQALGLNESLRNRLVDACPNTLTGLRDRALIALGYDTLCRRAELVGLRVEDITATDKNSAQILVRRSKTDPYGSGRLAYVSASTLKLVRDWLKAAGIESGYIFRAVWGARIGATALNPYTVNRILKKAARAAGVPDDAVEHLSGHSMRGEFALQALIGADVLHVRHRRRSASSGRKTYFRSYRTWPGLPRALTPSAPISRNLSCATARTIAS